MVRVESMGGVIKLRGSEHCNVLLFHSERATEIDASDDWDAGVRFEVE